MCSCNALALAVVGLRDYCAVTACLLSSKVMLMGAVAFNRSNRSLYLFLCKDCVVVLPGSILHSIRKSEH